MINIFLDNVNNYTMQFKKGDINLSSNFIKHTSPPNALKQIIRFISNPADRPSFEYAVFDAPLEEMPLLINVDDKRELIARWRMKIGK
jgi:hypothetical protein